MGLLLFSPSVSSFSHLVLQPHLTLAEDKLGVESGSDCCCLRACNLPALSLHLPHLCGPQSMYSVSLTAPATLVSLLSLEPAKLSHQEALALAVLATWIIYHSAPGQLLQEAFPDSPSHSRPHFPPLPLLLLGVITLQNWLEGCGFPTHRIEGGNLGFIPNFCHM